MSESIARELALLWRENGPPAPLVVGPDETVEPLVRAWRELGVAGGRHGASGCSSWPP
ncbi:hypothetical protein AB0M92_08380 [Streptomyces sp. NPDC051582]|uniref:hypothetical protein n=1 Tax=Streptomyces sp. NPDC051582 TaxID=3155167 RepID=UPI00343AFB1D